jgi:hypothetical protein
MTRKVVNIGGNEIELKLVDMKSNRLKYYTDYRTLVADFNELKARSISARIVITQCYTRKESSPETEHLLDRFWVEARHYVETHRAA